MGQSSAYAPVENPRQRSRTASARTSLPAATALPEQHPVHVASSATQDPSVRDPIARWCQRHQWLAMPALAGSPAGALG